MKVFNVSWLDNGITLTQIAGYTSKEARHRFRILFMDRNGVYSAYKIFLDDFHFEVVRVDWQEAAVNNGLTGWN